MLKSITKTDRLADPVATTGDRVYVVCSQNGLFPDPWGGHVPHEMWGVWDHPIKLLDGFWFAVRDSDTGVTRWLMEADSCTVGLGYTEFHYRLDDVHITRRDFVPDGLEALVITITIEAPQEHPARRALIATFRSDLRPAWLGERAGMMDHTDSAVVLDRKRVLFRDSGNPWFCLIGGDADPVTVETSTEVTLLQQTIGQGINASLTFHPTDSVPLNLFIAGSGQSEADVLATYEKVHAAAVSLFTTKQAAYAGLIEQSSLDSPDPTVNDAFEWAKVNCQMLARDVPGRGRGVGAGLPTYPWWFGIDSEYAVLPMLQTGQFELVKATLRLLKQASEQHNTDEPGRVIHELTTTGTVYNPGNLVETPAFVRAVHQTWLWTGDAAFLQEMYPFCKRGILDYTLGQCDPDGDLCASGRSIIETLEMHAGFKCLDVAAYTWEALLRLADMAQVVGDTEIVEELHTKAEKLGQHIREAWWLEEEGLFADIRGSVEQVQNVLEGIAERAQHVNDPGFQQQARKAQALFQAGLAQYADAPIDVDLPWLLRHWVVMCPIEVGLATREQAAKSLARLTSPEFCNAWGMYLHPERADVMSINTGLLTLALARYGQMDTALCFVHQQAATLPLHMPGAISEALPDRWCFIQLWSAVGVISPIVEGILGIAPHAAERRLSVIPNLPAGWDRVAMKNIHIGDTTFDVTVERATTQYLVTVEGSETDFKLEIGAYVPEDAQVTEVILNGRSSEWHWKTTTSGGAVVCDAPLPAQMSIHWIAES